MSPPSDSNRFAQAWDEFLLALRRSQARGLPGEELTLAQYYLLAPLLKARAVPITQLAIGAGISAPTASKVIDGLEREGMVSRQRSADDRRAVLVAITPQGTATFKRRARQMAHRRRLIYERLAPEEREPSERLLRHLAQVIGEL